jgi:hypothetical protein
MPLLFGGAPERLRAATLCPQQTCPRRFAGVVIVGSGEAYAMQGKLTQEANGYCCYPFPDGSRCGNRAPRGGCHDHAGKPWPSYVAPASDHALVPEIEDGVPSPDGPAPRTTTVDYQRESTGRDGKTTVFTAIVSQEDERPAAIRVHRMEQGVARRIALDYMADAWPARDSAYGRAEELLGKKATVLIKGENVFGWGAIVAQEVTVAEGTRGLVGVPKGKRRYGVRLSPDSLVDVEQGWGQAAAFQDRAEEILGRLPAMSPVSQEDFAAIATTSEVAWADHEDEPEPEPIKMVLMETRSILDGRVGGCVWMVTNVVADAGIIEGYMRVPDHSGYVSEHGSEYLEHFLTRPVVKLDVSPGMTFADALRTGELSDEEFFSMLGDGAPAPSPAGLS